jgi:NADH-quinone oxidoreductase subunit J
MSNVPTGIEVLCLLSVVFGVASLLSRENFYSALYMCLTMICIAGIYAYYGVHSAFALITLIFIGALGAVTLVLAYSYRGEKSVEHKLRWIFFALTVAVFLASIAPFTVINPRDYVTSLIGFEPIFLLFSLSLLVMIPLIEVWRCRS